MKKILYKVKPEFIDLWGAEVNADTLFSRLAIEDLAAWWEMPLETLMEQVYEVSIDE